MKKILKSLFGKIKEAGIFSFDIILNVIILFAIVFLIREFLIAPFQVSGPSMCDTMNYYNGECQDGYGEYIILNKLTYFFNDPQRYDIVVFRPPNHKDVFYIKRIIGMPGDEIEFKDDGYVYLNGEKMDEPYLNEDNLGKTESKWLHRVKIHEGEYLVLGDNRNQSTDSRTCFTNNIYGCTKEGNTEFLTKKDIEGKAWIVLWPFSQARIIDHPPSS
jgi:signal peptidase I